MDIVLFDIPFPADYGGAMDVYYRLVNLRDLGFQLTLHVFEYGRSKAPELEELGTVYYYPRKLRFIDLLSKEPFIVKTRRNTKLLSRLAQGTGPIVFEGIHCTAYLGAPVLEHRKQIVRAHNIEHSYYRGLAKGAYWRKKIFFLLEAWKLKNYEPILRKAAAIWAIKESDGAYFLNYSKNVTVVPASVPFHAYPIAPTERYALIHGNLSVSENSEAVRWIIQTLDTVTDASYPIIVAGKNPSTKLSAWLHQKGVQVVANPTEKELQKLLQHAGIHLHYSELSTGVKLKLLHSLMGNGHVLCSKSMIGSSSLTPFCTIADEPKEYKLHFLGLKQQALEPEKLRERKLYIQAHYSGKKELITALTGLMD